MLVFPMYIRFKSPFNHDSDLLSPLTSLKFNLIFEDAVTTATAPLPPALSSLLDEFVDRLKIMFWRLIPQVELDYLPEVVEVI